MNENAETVAENEIPTNTPMCFFSDDKEVSAVGWKEALTGYLSKINIGEYMHLDAGRYVHYDKSEIIAGESKAFIGEIKQTKADGFSITHKIPTIDRIFLSFYFCHQKRC